MDFKYVVYFQLVLAVEAQDVCMNNVGDHSCSAYIVYTAAQYCAVHLNTKGSKY